MLLAPPDQVFHIQDADLHLTPGGIRMVLEIGGPPGSPPGSKVIELRLDAEHAASFAKSLTSAVHSLHQVRQTPSGPVQ